MQTGSTQVSQGGDLGTTICRMVELYSWDGSCEGLEPGMYELNHVAVSGLTVGTVSDLSGVGI